MRQSIQEWTSKFCGRQPLKNLKGYGLLKQTISLQIFLSLSSKKYSPLLNTLSQMFDSVGSKYATVCFFLVRKLLVQITQ